MVDTSSTWSIDDGVGDRERAEQPDDETGPQSVEVDDQRRDSGSCEETTSE